MAAITSVMGVACTWVPVDAEAEGVRVAAPSEVEGCEKVVTTTVSVLAKVAGVERSEEKVAGELATLARNEAARRGADAVVANGAPEDGRQSFDLYRCDSD